MELRKCPVCGGKLRSEALGWICYDCQGFIDMQGVFHEHKEKPFMTPMTNADRIRDMTDEELARFLDDVHWSAFEAKGRLSRLKHPVDANDWCEWLEQPAEGE